MPSGTLVLVGLAALLGVLTVVAVGYAVALDAGARSATDPATLGVAAALLAVPVVPLYVLLRGRLGDRGPPTRSERRARTVALGGLLTFTLAGAVPIPDPYTQVLSAVTLFVPMLAVAHLLVGR